MKNFFEINRALVAKKKLLLTFALMMATLFSAQTAQAGEKKVYSAYKEGTVTYYYDDMAESRQNNGYIVEDFPNMDHFESYYEDIKYARIDPSMKEAALISTRYMFSRNSYSYINNIESITGLENLNTVEVTTMSHMFCGCQKLTSLDLRYFNTNKVKNMEYMFRSCLQLQTLDLSSFNTSNVMSMGNMFNGCHALTSLDISHFDISKVTEMDYMFFYCPNLTTIYCDEDWSTYPSISSTNMFKDCL